MKGILNVLYRRILYKIPLKFLLVLLAIGSILFACANADMNIPTSNWNGNYIYGDLYDYILDNVSVNSNTKVIVSDDIDFVCLKRGNSAGYYSIDGVNYNNAFTYEWGCTNEKEFRIRGNIHFSYFQFGEGFVPIYFDSAKCQTEYNLIPISSVDSSYCQSNNLCPSLGGSSGDVSWSALYINNIQHLGGPNIYIDIPEEFSRDYDYIDEDMYIDIEGYNVDYDKITGIIDTQNYKPDSEDFTYIVKNIIPLFVPGLVIILFLYWIFRFIKKIF